MGASARELDSWLTSLFNDIGRDPKNPLLREFAVLGLGTLISERPEIPAEAYLKTYHALIAESLSPQFLATYSLEALERVEDLCEAVTGIAGECIPGGRESCIAYSRQRIREITGGFSASEDGATDAIVDEDPLRDWQVTSTAGPVWGALVTGYPAGNPLIRIGKALEFRLGLEITGEWSRKPKREVVEFGGRTLLKKDEFEEQLRESVRFAENQFVEIFKAREIPGLNRRYLFEAFSGPQGYSSPPFTGGSAGLALSMLSMSALDGLRVRNRQRRMVPGTAFTGQIDRTGRVLKVDDSEIPVKTRAVFRSPCTRFVVPEENYESASKTLEELKRANPDRELELIPAANIRDVYEDDRISSESAVSVPSIAINRARRRRKTLITGISSAVAVVSLAAVAAFSLVFFTKDLNSVQFDGKKIECINRFGNTYREIDLPYRVNVKEENNYDDNTGKSHRLLVDDIDGDGKRDLLFIGVEANSKDTDYFGTLHVHLFNNEGDEIRHVAAFDSIGMAIEDTTLYFRDVSYRKDAVIDLDGDGFKEVVLYFVDRLYFPSGVTVFSVKDEVAQTFIHAGHIQQMIVDDYDDDGLSDIVVAAECSRTDNSVLIVLDPRHIQGSSPPLDWVKFPGYEQNVAKYLILAPKSVVFDAQYGVERNYVERPNIRTLFVTENDRVQIGVCEWNMCNTCAVLLYTFGPDWRCTEVGTTEPYDQEFDRLKKDGHKQLRGITKNEYLESLKSGFRYLDGKAFIAGPVMNSGYRELMEIHAKQAAM